MEDALAVDVRVAVADQAAVAVQVVAAIVGRGVMAVLVAVVLAAAVRVVDVPVEAGRAVVAAVDTADRVLAGTTAGIAKRV